MTETIDPQELKKKFDDLINIGVALASEQRLDNLLERIVTEARRFTCADAGSLYIREDNKIRFVVSQNDTLRKRHGAQREKENFLTFTMPISADNLAGYSALTGKILNIPDAYNLTGDYPKINKSFDEKNNYRSTSMLVVPMQDVEKYCVGVIQLINAKDENGQIIPFKKECENLTYSLASQAAVAVRNAQLREELKESNMEMIHRLSVAAEFRDEDTALHIKRMSYYSQIIAKGLGFSDEEAENILFTAPMHDIGKLGVPDAILLKPGKLTNEEFDEMKRHTSYGAQILKGSQYKIIQQSETIAISHHEKWNGMGYPYGLKGEEIPIEGRIVALADVFDALTSKRCYKPAFPLDKVERIIKNDTGTHFDPAVVKAFFKHYDEILDVYYKFREI
jgi:HD-GYP domain-containing protein (c-di-GMP phosphodiesterase class II)